jgi:D-glycero-D-manno-heptose 1,7-bisphosphate phosphatase
MLKAVILDRDGTLNRTTDILRPGQKPGDKTDGYVLSPEELQLFPAVKPALALLRKNNILPFVFTQQNCITKGLITEDGVHAIHARMNTLLGPEAAIEEFHLATEGPRAKPSPAMILEIMEKYGYAKDEVLVVGDSKRDHQSALAAGVPYVWVRDDKKRVSEEDMKATGCPVFDNVLEMAENLKNRYNP